MKRLTALAIVLVLAGSVPAVALAAPQGPGQLTGSVRDAGDRPAANVLVRLRNLDTGVVAGTTTTNSGGAYAFTGVAPGNYVVEVLDASGQILATSAALSVSAGQGLAGVLVTLSSIAEKGALAAFFTSTTGIVVLAAAGAGIGFAVYEATKSASR